MNPDEGKQIDPESTPPPVKSRHHLHRVAFGITLLLIIAVLIVLPFAMQSMGTLLFGRQQVQLYDLLNSQIITPQEVAGDRNRESYFNLAVIGIDQTNSALNLGLSGSRVCPAACPEITITAFALDENNAAVRRGLPPSASLTLTPADVVYTGTMQLPIAGRPSLYPFDTWTVWLGLQVSAKGANGLNAPVTAAFVRDRAVITIQNQASDFLMNPPATINPERARALTDQASFLTVQALEFHRPAYLRLITGILMTLIAVSGILALLTRSVDDLVLGIGGLIMGIWGIRGILAPQPVPTVTAVDLGLSTVILLILLGLALRGALYFHERGKFPWSRRGASET